MPSDTTMNVNLSRDLYAYVKAAVKSGRYTSASEVVRDALRAKRNALLQEVQRKVEQGLESARRGELLDDDAVFEQLRAMSRTRRAAQKAKK